VVAFSASVKPGRARVLSLSHVAPFRALISVPHNYRLNLARIIHECYRALACPFVCNEPLVGRPYAWLRTPFSESVADKGTACLPARALRAGGRAIRTGRRNHHGDS
jgi:hypothetical protein